MKKIIIRIALIIICLALGFALGAFMVTLGEENLLGNYDLYQCIYYNSAENNFPQSAIMITKIQDDCICFREHDYTDFLEGCRE